MNFILVTEKRWHLNLFQSLQKDSKHSWHLINSKEELSYKNLKLIDPDIIFIPHWSYLISNDIYDNFECIVFHMTDLPYGRGGSPLQNLIVRGNEKTKISAIRVEKGLDTGDIYIKRSMGLEGTASEILQKSTSIIEEMISDIIKNKIQPVPQVGEVVEFKRRKPEESNIAELDDLEKVYDYIRMLDCEGYPHAFFETPHFKFEFINAEFDRNEEIINANVRIIKK